MARHRILLLVGGIALVAGACSRATGDGETGVLTLEAYFGMGEKRVERVLERPEHAELRAAVRLAEQAVVRVRVEFGRKGGSFSSNHGSGVLVWDHYHVLTAAHTLAPIAEHMDAFIEVRFWNGAITLARALGSWKEGLVSGERDWALLELEPASPSEIIPLELDASAPTGLLALLGFPGRIGRRPESGHIVQDDTGHATPLLALRLLGRLVDGDPSAFLAAHGAIPIGGVSGGAVIDAHAHVVAIQRAITESVSGDRVDRRLDLVPVRDMADDLRAMGLAVSR